MARKLPGTAITANTITTTQLAAPVANVVVSANAAYDQANSAYSTANTANTNALNAYGQANAAYSAANNAINSGGASFSWFYS